MYFVYILESSVNGRWYIGSSDNPNRRLAEHNSGATSSTKAYRPYKLLWIEAFVTKQEAQKRERLIKCSGRIRKELKHNLAPSSNG